MNASFRFAALSLCALMLVSGLPTALAHDHPASNNCTLGTGGTCLIKKPSPVNLSILACDDGVLGVATYGGKGLDQGGPSCTADFWTIQTNTNVYQYTDLATYYRVTKDPSGDFMVQSFHLNKFGEDVYLQANYTLVNNGTLIKYTAHNHASTPVDLGWKYSWDLQLDSKPDPVVYVDNRPGDGQGAAGTYNSNEVDLGPDSHDIRYVKSWQTRSGPDGPSDLKEYYWFDQDWGSCGADRINYINSGAAFGQASSLTYQPNISGTTSVTGDSEMQVYYGSPELIHLAPDDGADGGPDEFECVMWMGTGIPDPLISYHLDGYFTNRGEGSTFSTAFVDPGQTVSFPVTLVSDTFLGQGKNINMRFHAGLEGTLPRGWSASLVDDNTGQPVEDVVLSSGEQHHYRLDLTAPRDAFGNDAARLVVNLQIADPPHGLFNKKASQFKIPLAATAIVRPNYGLSIKGPEDEPTTLPGEQLQIPLAITNVGNLREPLNVEVACPLGCPVGGIGLEPNLFALGRGVTQNVTATLTIPADAPGGERTAVFQAGVPERDQNNKTQVKYRVLSNSAIQIIPEQDEIKLAPGATGIIKARVQNVGFDEQAVDLHAVVDEVKELLGGDSGSSAANQWAVEVVADGFDVPLPPGASLPLTVQVTAPQEAKAGEQKNVLLLATQQGGTNEFDKQLVRAVVTRSSALVAAAPVEVLSANPGNALQYEVKFTNNGNSIENLTVDMTALPAGWTADIQPDRFQLADGGQERTVAVTILTAPGALAGSYPLEVQARNADQVRQQSASASLTARINQVYGGLLSTETSVVHMLPKDTEHVVFQVTNTGNGADSFTLEGIPASWDAHLEPAVTPPLQPGQSALMYLNGTFSGQIGTQKVPLTIVSAGSSAPAMDSPLPFTLIVSRPDLFVKSAKVESPASHPGDLEVISAEVQNLGGIEAKNVRVELFVDGKSTHVVADFDRLAPDRTLVASLPWTRTAGEHSYRVEVDPENAIDEGDAEGNNAFVFRADGASAAPLQLLGSDGQIASHLSPGAGLWMAVGLLACAALTVRRRHEG